MPEIFGKRSKESVTSEIDEMLASGTKNQWSSLITCPENLRFESQHNDETVIILGRRHLITNLGWISVLSFAIFIPAFWRVFPFFQILDSETMLGVNIVWYLSLLFYGIYNFLFWFYNVYIVTTDRLIDVDFTGLLSKVVNVTQLEDIADINYAQKGIIAGMFDYGDVIVQTASEQKTPDASGELSAFTFEMISSPNRVTTIISKLLEREDRKHENNK